MKRYVLTSFKTLGEVVYRFDDADMIISCEVSPNMPEEDRLRVFKNVPKNVETLMKWKERPTLKIEFIPDDLSFDFFWRSYDYKVGNKAKCKKLWESLSDDKKAKALSMIQRYKQWAAGKNIDRVYPERYLSQERFDNVFR